MTFDEKQFFLLLNGKKDQTREENLINIIEQYGESFFSEHRYYFNHFFLYGDLNIIKYCEKFSNFSLYNHEQSPAHLDNIAFIWAIKGANLEVVDYILNSSEVSFFLKNDKLDEQIGKAVSEYVENRNGLFEMKHYEEMLFYFAKTFPSSIKNVFDNSVRVNENDVLTPILKNFFNQYRQELTTFLLEHESDALTLLCMLSTKKNSNQFATFLRHEYKSIQFDKGTVTMFLYYVDHNIAQTKWILDNPDFVKLEKDHFKELFKRVFLNPFKNKINKRDYEYFDFIVNQGLYELTKYDYQTAISNDLLKFVKKYAKNFDLEELNKLIKVENSCSCFIEQSIVKKNYKKLNKSLKKQHITTSRNKI